MALVSFYDATDIDEQQLKSVLKHGDVDCVFVDEELSADNIHADTEILSVFVTSEVTRELLAKMPKLRLIACRSTGFNNIDLEAAAERNILVTNVPTYGENTVAEYVFTLILALGRQLLPAIDAGHTGIIDPEALIGHDLNERVLGIIGTGHIGKCVAKIAHGFNMKVVAYDPFPDHEAAEQLGFLYVPLDQLLTMSDIVTLHVPYSPDTHHLIGKDELKLMKSTSLLINTARGEIVNTKDLVQAIQQHRIAGAGLDVLEGEKLLQINEEILLLKQQRVPSELLRLSIELDLLKKMPNTIITPHNAYNTAEAILRINQTTGRNILSFLDQHPINMIKKTDPKPGKLLLVRHGESEWNALGKWSGIRDVHLNEKGFHEAALLGQAIQDFSIDYAYTSQQIRALETLEGMLDAAQQFDVPFERTDTINERDYGDYTGKNKWEMRDLIGEDAWNRVRRGWNEPVPGGETLKMVFERSVPFYKSEIVPKLRAGKNVLVVSHGNALRALIKYIEIISDESISTLEMPFGNILIYEVDNEGHKVKKEEIKINTTAPPA